MDEWPRFLRHHARTHAAEVSDLQPGSTLADSACEGLSHDQLRLAPHSLNSIAWLLWHLGRLEDVVANPILLNRSQVFDDGEWTRRLNVSRRDVGTEMTPEEVVHLSTGVDIPSLRAYRNAVGKRTRESLGLLQSLALDAEVAPEGVQRAVSQGALTERAGWVADLWATRANAWFLDWEIVGHNYMHLGQALWVRKLVMTTG